MLSMSIFGNNFLNLQQNYSIDQKQMIKTTFFETVNIWS